MAKKAWAFPTESFEQERKRKKKSHAKGFAAWMGIVKGGPGSGNHGHCGGEGGDNNPGGSKPASECGGEQSAEERGGEKFEAVGGTSNHEYAKLGPDEEYKEALSKNKQDKFGSHRSLEPGTPVALRIDIPAYNSTGKYVVTVHKYTGGKSVGTPIGYDSIVRLSGEVVFASNEKGAETILTGESNKYPLATVKGKFETSRELPEDFEDWTPVGYNPKTAAYFYDKRTGDEITGGEDAISVGNTVFIRVPDIGERNAKRRYKAFSRWMGLTKGGPGSGNYGHCGGTGGKDNPGGSRPAGECGLSGQTEPMEVPEFAESSRDLKKLGEDEEWDDVSGTRRVTVFHFSREDRSQTGLKRGFAGTAAAGEERASMEYENGRLKTESAVIHAYLYGAKREKVVPGKVMHKIEATMSVLDVGSDIYQGILDEAQKEAYATGRPKLAIAREQARIRGYDALVSQRHGIMQILRDISPKEITVMTREGEIGYEIKASDDYIQKNEQEQKRYHDSAISYFSSGRAGELTMAYVRDAMTLDGILNQMIADERVKMPLATAGEIQDRILQKQSPEDISAVKSALESHLEKVTDKDAAEEYARKLKYGIVSGKTKEQLIEEGWEQRVDLLKKSKLAIRVPVSVVNKVFDDQRMKSQFETGSSQGALNDKMRRDFEKGSMGVPWKIEDSKRPIYGYVSDEHGLHDNSSLRHYGHVAFILKEGLKDRTTVTFGDSLDHRLPASMYRDPKQYSVAPAEFGEVTLKTSLYTEAQIHGGVSMNDVEDIIVSEQVLVDARKDRFDSFAELIENASFYSIDVKVAVNKSGRIKKTSVAEYLNSVKDIYIASSSEPEGTRRAIEEVIKLSSKNRG